MLKTRTATQADAALIAAHRKAMCLAMKNANETSMKSVDEAVLEAVRRNSEPWVAKMIAENKYFGWIVSDDGKPVASAGMLILDWPPHPFDPDGEHRAYLLNVFVELEYRRRGLAHELVRLCMAEAERRRIGVVTLHSSDEGRPIYESFGFHATNEMMHVEGSIA